MSDTEFKNESDVEAWLTDQPMRVAHSLYSRAALRALPRAFPVSYVSLEVSEKENAELFLLHCFRAAFLNWTYGFYPDQRSDVLLEGVQAAASALNKNSKPIRDLPVLGDELYNVGGALYTASQMLRHIDSSVPTDWDYLNGAMTPEERASGLFAPIAQDIAWLERNSDKKDGLHQRRLWQLRRAKDFVGMAHPNWVRTGVERLRRSDLIVNRGWVPWLRWYRGVLPVGSKEPKSAFGESGDLLLARQPNEFWERPQKEVISDINLILSGNVNADPVSNFNVDDVPGQIAGPSFIVSSSGKLSVADSGLISNDDASEIEGTRSVIVEALSDLESACAGSNAFQSLKSVVALYRATIAADITRVSIDKLYAYGVRLENANFRIKKEIASGDLPEQGVRIGEAMDSVIALHGSIVMSTERGRELLARARDFHQTALDVASYRAEAQRFADAVRTADALIDDQTKEFVVAANRDIAEGRHPDRSTDLARTVNANLLSIVAKIVLTPVSAITGAAFLASGVGQASVIELAALVDAASLFLSANAPQIQSLAAAAASELSWISSLLAWFTRGMRKS